MEVAQYYINRYHKAMDALNVLSPSIEPHASGHIIEQIELVKEILKNGYAYESEGSVYFDVENTTRTITTASSPDATWMMFSTPPANWTDRARSTIPQTLLSGNVRNRNTSCVGLPPWSDGFPGWHAECTAMGKKYLGEHFDIHGGGMDLIFPHHECEIAQSVASQGEDMVHYWMHNNMLTVNGQKMGKSYGNFITLEELFKGTHPMLEQAYSPMTIRFFTLQAHYRSTVDFSNEALQAAEKGLAS